SGGERGRVALAKLALEGANFLLLDEPTNHLDIPSQEILEAVLSDFEGTILLISHDRYLIDALATQIWALEAGRLETFKGSYREFVERRAITNNQLPITKSQKTDGKTKIATAKAAKPSSEERRRAQRAEELELIIGSLEKRLAEISAELEAAGTDVEKVRTLGEEYVQVESDLATRLAEWERVLQAV
ncbi:MAG: ABC transporter ATP-binding protein, partial [Chloroflexota bacterium]